MSKFIFLRLLLPAVLLLSSGFIAGSAWQSHFGESAGYQTLDSDLQDYHRAIVDVLSLSGEQQDDLKLLLYYYQQERENLYSSSLARVDEEWANLDQRFESLIFARVLNQQQRLRMEDLRQPDTLDFTALQR